MPSYRYTKDIKPEDLQQQQAPALSTKEQRKNWWHYHWKIVAIVAVVAIILGMFVTEMVRKVKPDITVGILTTTALPESLTAKLEEEIGAFVGDANGDGKVTVQVNVYVLQPYTEEEEEEMLAEAEEDTLDNMLGNITDPYQQMAGVTQLTAAMADKESYLYFVMTDEIEVFQRSYGVLGRLDGTSGTDAAPEELALAWDEAPGLVGMDLSFSLYDETVYDGQEVMSLFSVGIRAIQGTRNEGDEKAEANYAQAAALIDEWSR